LLAGIVYFFREKPIQFFDLCDLWKRILSKSHHCSRTAAAKLTNKRIAALKIGLL